MRPRRRRHSTTHKSALRPNMPCSTMWAAASQYAKSETVKGRSCRASRSCALERASRQPTIRPNARCSDKKDELEQKIDTLKYQKAAMDPDDYKKQLTEALVELAKVQEELDK